LDYTLTPGDFVSSSATTGQTGFEAITGSVVDGIVDLFAVSYTAADDNPNGLYAIADTLSATTAGSETFTELASSPGSGQENFKGVSFDPAAVPEPSTWVMILSGISVLCVVAYGQKLRQATGKF
jgi:hypothetical protein